MFLRRHAILFVSVLMLWGGGITATRAESSPEPAGRVISFPAKAFAYGMSADGEDTQANVLVPNKMDDEGTLTVTYSTRSQSASRLEIRRDDLPEDLQFLCGDNESITLLTSRPGGYVSFSPGQLSNVISIPYNRNTPTTPGRMFQLIDCQETPLTGDRFEVKISQQGFGLYSNLRLGTDGKVQVPAVINTPAIPPRPGFVSQSSVGFSIKDKETGLAYSVQVNQDGKTSTTRLILPLTVNKPTSSTVSASASIKNNDGSALGGVSVTLTNVRSTNIYSYMPGQPPVLDEADIPVRSLVADARGDFTVAVSPLMTVGKTEPAGIAVSVRQPDVAVYAESEFPLSPGAHRDIVMPKRLTVPFVCVDESGEPIRFQVKDGHMSYQFSFYRVTDDGETQDRTSISFSPKETSGTEFLLKGLPVPGRYMLNWDENYYGPVDVPDSVEKLEFPIKPNNGMVKGRVLDEHGKPLPGALILYTTRMYESRRDIKDLGAVLEHLKGLDETAALAYLNEQTSGVVAYRITGDDGTYQFPRGKRQQTEQGYVALGVGRIGAYHYDVNDSNSPLYRDIPITDIHLPITTTITGIVNAPEQIPDRAHNGKLVPLPRDQEYCVGLRESRGWFDQGFDKVRWQYITSSKAFKFGEPFRYDVPVGTTVSVYATPVNDDVKLSLEIWKLDPLAEGETRETTASTLRALQPYTLHVQYEDGSPGSGIEVNTLYGDRQHVQGQEYRTPQTDANGNLPLWGDEGLAPSMHLRRPYRPPTGPFFRPTPQPYQSVKIQKLDMSTSVPKLTLTLDPEKWGSSPEAEQ